MAYPKNSPIRYNPSVKSLYSAPFLQKGTPLPPPPPTGNFELLNHTPFLLLDGTNFKLFT